MKGIILAGGTGTRLFPSTIACSKQMLSVYDKPMIYYPLSVLMLSGIREILVIVTQRDIELFRSLLGDGSKLGISIEYAVQDKPRGLADAFIVGADFIGSDSVCLILGDNIFYGDNFTKRLSKIAKDIQGGVIFGYHVTNPNEFGVVEFDKNGKAISIEEKPIVAKSNYAIPGLYYYDNNVVEIAKSIKPSGRGELEITSIHSEYLKQGRLQVEIFGRGTVWLDTGNHKDMLDAAIFVEAIQTRQGLYVACLEEIAYRKKYIDKNRLLELGESLKSTEYGKYILSISNDSFIEGE